MSKIFKKRLVIDASVARASGHRSVRGQICIRFLDVVKEICNQLVMTENIWEEWDRNASTYAIQWAASMKSIGKLRDVVDGDSAALERKIEALDIGEGQKREMLKDVCLITAAKASDCRVVSLDEEARRLYKKFGGPLAELKGIVWVNPEREEEDAVRWLERGTPNDGALLLRST